MNPNKTLTLCLFVSVLATACAGNQSDTATTESAPAAAQQVATQEDARDPNAIRCKRYAETGSRIGKKVCMTNAEWDKSAADSREATERLQRGTVHGGMEGG